MAIYLLFIQHIISSLNNKGKAAVVVPTGFLTEGKGKATSIANKIRMRFVDKGWLRALERKSRTGRTRRRYCQKKMNRKL
jgi:type I restriction enzyme M protein